MPNFCNGLGIKVFDLNLSQSDPVQYLKLDDEESKDDLLDVYLYSYLIVDDSKLYIGG